MTTDVVEPEVEVTLTPLVARLLEAQRLRGWDDGDVAELLGVHRTTWLCLRSGQRQPGLQFLRGVYQDFPEGLELRKAVQMFLADVPEVTGE